jgi:hypothetical protein
MARQTSNPGMMVVGGLIFLAAPVLWAKASSQPLNWTLMCVCIAIAALFFYLAAKYKRERGEPGSP